MKLDNDFLRRITLIQYLGKMCPFCGHIFETLEDLEQNAVYAGHNAIACKRCWEQHNGLGAAQGRDGVEDAQ